MELKERINKGIAFLRGFSNLSDKELYKKSVLRFVELVDEYVNPQKTISEIGEEIFNEKSK